MRRVIAIGTDFSEANFMYTDCEGLIARQAKFRHTVLEMGRFVRADFRYGEFYKPNFVSANLSEADMTCTNFCGYRVPIVRDLDVKIAGFISRPEYALRSDNFHTCKTVHNRAGWAVHLAGRPGYLLERKLGTLAAGCLIYAVSCPCSPIPDMFEETVEAINSIYKAARFNPPS